MKIWIKRRVNPSGLLPKHSTVKFATQTCPAPRRAIGDQCRRLSALLKERAAERQRDPSPGATPGPQKWYNRGMGSTGDGESWLTQHSTLRGAARLRQFTAANSARCQRLHS